MRGEATFAERRDQATSARLPRVPLYVVSDLHLGDTSLATMFRDSDQGFRFADICAGIARNTGSELLLLGDIFDLTATQPPPKGLSQFGRALDVPLEDKPTPSIVQVMKDIRETNAVALDALEALSNEAEVTLVPGNHDRHLAEPAGREALDAAGLAKVKIEPMAVRRVMDKIVVLQHGHTWDPANATPAGGGETMTAVIHHAIVPFLRHLKPRSNVRIDPDRIVALRPEERVVPVLERWLKPGVFERFIDAFLELLVANDFLSRPLAWLTTPSAFVLLPATNTATTFAPCAWAAAAPRGIVAMQCGQVGVTNMTRHGLPLRLAGSNV